MATYIDDLYNIQNFGLNSKKNYVPYSNIECKQLKDKYGNNITSSKYSVDGTFSCLSDDHSSHDNEIPNYIKYIVTDEIREYVVICLIGVLVLVVLEYLHNGTIFN